MMIELKRSMLSFPLGKESIITVSGIWTPAFAGVTFLFLLLLTFCVLSLPAHAQEEAITIPYSQEPCEELAAKLLNCEPYSCKREHSEKGHTIYHAIEGLSPDGATCRHLQSLPDDQVIVCQYSEPMRFVIAKLTAEGENSLSQGEQSTLSEAFGRECKVLTMDEFNRGPR